MKRRIRSVKVDPDPAPPDPLETLRRKALALSRIIINLELKIDALIYEIKRLAEISWGMQPFPVGNPTPQTPAETKLLRKLENTAQAGLGSYELVIHDDGTGIVSLNKTTAVLTKQQVLLMTILADPIVGESHDDGFVPWKPIPIIATLLDKLGDPSPSTPATSQAIASLRRRLRDEGANHYFVERSRKHGARLLISVVKATTLFGNQL